MEGKVILVIFLLGFVSVNAWPTPFLSSDSCENDELYPDPNDCGAFYSCSNGVLIQFLCPDGLYFDNVNKICDWPENVDCGNGPSPTVRPSTVPTAEPTAAPTTSAAPTTTEAPATSAAPPSSEAPSTSEAPPDTTAQPSTTEWPEQPSTVTTELPTFTTEQPEFDTCPPIDPEIVVQLPHPDCTKFYKCSEGIPYEMLCPGGLYWNNALSICDYKGSAKCVENAAPEQPNAVTLKP